MDDFATRTEGGYTGLLARRDFAAGEIICALPCTAESAVPTRYTVQIGRDRHVEVGPFAFLNHSCDPSVVLDTARMQVVATRAIVRGDELTFFYPSTEWDMACPFSCRCGSPDCIGLVTGARFLPVTRLQRHQPSAHIIALLAEHTDTSGAVARSRPQAGRTG